jgi:hypothetical protein
VFGCVPSVWAHSDFTTWSTCSLTADRFSPTPHSPFTLYRLRTLDQNEQLTYPPLNTLKRVVEDVWIVDGPVIRFGMPWPKMPFPTRMTVIRLVVFPTKRISDACWWYWLGFLDSWVQQTRHNLARGPTR